MSWGLQGQGEATDALAGGEDLSIHPISGLGTRLVHALYPTWQDVAVSVLAFSSRRDVIRVDSRGGEFL